MIAGDRLHTDKRDVLPSCANQPRNTIVEPVMSGKGLMPMCAFSESSPHIGMPSLIDTALLPCHIHRKYDTACCDVRNLVHYLTASVSQENIISRESL